MPRGNTKARKIQIQPDSRFDSAMVAKFINYIMLNGKKTVANDIVFSALDLASAKLSADPLDIFYQVLKNVGPILEVKSRRIGGANYQVPMEVNKDRKNTLAMRWIINYAKQRSEKTMEQKLAGELQDAAQSRGGSVKKREDTHRMADANKAFAHYRW